MIKVITVTLIMNHDYDLGSDVYALNKYVFMYALKIAKYAWNNIEKYALKYKKTWIQTYNMDIN